MADTDTETLPNGTGPLSAEEEERLKQRPADIDADVREMERRKRVEALMSSKLFREELERVLDQQLHEGNDAPLLQRIREMVGGRLHTGSLRGPSCVLPINDIRGIEGVGYEKGEKILRCKLAAVYRLVDLFGWTQTGISGQITARLNTAVEQVLTTPRGLLPHEVTASSLVKVDMQGVVQDQGTTNFPVNVEGFSLHASVHAARPDVRCVLHVRSAGALAVSATRRGLLPLCSEAALLGDVAYHRVPNGTLDNEERDKLVRALGPHAKVLMLSGGGALCCGATLEEAFFQAKNLNAACEVQLRLASLPLDELYILDEETRRQMFESSRKPPSDANKWRVGGEEFEALMRMLDNAGFRTGYIYRHPLIKNDVPKPKNDVEVPPAVSSLGYLLEEEELYRQGLWKKGTGKAGERTRWLNSPNVYQKVEVLETGTSDPKKITKWVQDGSPAHSGTPVKIDTLQFVPKNTNPKEFKQLQQQIKDNRRADKISAGPQSHILEGVTWDEASKLVGEDAVNTHTGDHVVLMGAASKGIIQRGYQHNAAVYSAPYARNPFDHVTDNEIDEYRRTVERKQRHDYDTDISESEAVSAAQVTSPNTAPSDTEDESRDEQRVLRIETKQVPVRSQPEVVLSDVDTTDFLAAEREHADRTRDSARDPNLLSDDEVFLDSTSSVPSGTSSVPVHIQMPVQGPVVIRQYTTTVQGTVGRGTKLSESNEARSSHKRSLHKYSRNLNFTNTITKYEPDKHPKCKMSLNTKLNDENAIAIYNPGNFSSRSSLFSIPSLEWDCKVDFSFRTRSLPRKSKTDGNKLYRTRSHSSFINSYIKDPEPIHFHVPKCNSCGTIISSYPRESVRENKFKGAHYSDGNIPEKCIDEIEFSNVKVKETAVPVLMPITSEFVESQEFNEDNYISDIGNSFSSANSTVIVKSNSDDIPSNNCEFDVNKKDNYDESNRDAKIYENSEIYEAIRVEVIESNSEANNISLESTEGEYHSFIDDLEFEQAVYESPVRDLVEKDIRDYSVPINFYCDEYNKKESPRKSPKKIIDLPKKTVLEPILEESKSSYDTSNDINKNELTIDDDNNQEAVDEVLSKSIKTDDLNSNLIQNEQQILTVKTEKDIKNDRNSSLSGTSLIERVSFDSTAEFEKYEIIADIVTSILGRIDFNMLTKDDNLKVPEKLNDEKIKEKVEQYFSITQIVKDIELELHLNETVSTEVSETDVYDSHKIIEAIMYYIFNSVFHICKQKKKKIKTKSTKNVVTIVDFEDILFTTTVNWLNFSLNNDDFNNNNDASKDLHLEENIGDLETYLQTNFISDKLDEFSLILSNNDSEGTELSNNDINESTINEGNVAFANDSKNDFTTEFNDDSTEVANDLISSLFDKSLKSYYDHKLNETYVIENMNTAFINDESSSFNGNIFKECTESPIKRVESSFIGDDLSVLYEKDDTILGSPFVKKANVLQMSQTSHSGGIKYWLSFDETLPVDEPKSKLRRNKELPSFLTVDFKDKSALNANNFVLTDARSDYDETFLTETCSNYNTCESNSRIENTNGVDLLGKEKLIFDSRHKTNRRLYSTWPSYEHTLFYRIASEFRLSESFDLSEHTVNGDHSDAHQSTFSHSSKEGSPSKEVSTEESPKKDKKKKKGLRTPSFLKKKKEKKKDKSSTPQPA
ncbi:unnamed protein product, partial [Brenthis ino]